MKWLMRRIIHCKHKFLWLTHALYGDSIPSNCSKNLCMRHCMNGFLWEKSWEKSHALTSQRILCVCRRLVSCPLRRYSALLQQLSASPQIYQCWQLAFCTWVPASAETGNESLVCKSTVIIQMQVKGYMYVLNPAQHTGLPKITAPGWR